MLKPLNNNVLIEVEKRPDEKTTKSGLIIGNKDAGDLLEKGKVLDAGEVTIVKKDDVVYFKSYAVDKIPVEGEKDKYHYFIKDESILGKE